MSVLPTTPVTDCYLRLHQITGRPKAVPPVAAIIPISDSAWWSGVASGRYPKPIKLSDRVTVWKASDIQKLVDGTWQSDAAVSGTASRKVATAS